MRLFTGDIFFLFIYYYYLISSSSDEHSRQTVIHLLKCARREIETGLLFAYILLLQPVGNKSIWRSEQHDRHERLNPLPTMRPSIRFINNTWSISDNLSCCVWRALSLKLNKL